MRSRLIISMLICISLAHVSAIVQGQTGVTVPSTDTNARPANRRGKANTNYQVKGSKVSMAAQPQTSRSLLIPATDSSIPREGEAALLAAPENVTDPSKVFAHTNYIVLSNTGIKPLAAGVQPAGETPDSIRSVYNVAANGGSKLIAIVDAFDYPAADADLSKFSNQFSLKPCQAADGCLRIVFAAGSRPPANCDWAGETALDLQWAHAMAPKANLLLVEAASDNLTDMFAAVDIAVNEVIKAGGGEVSLSWGSREFSGETALDVHLKQAGLVIFASSGDVGGVALYPSVSPYAVSVGGTKIVRKNGNFDSEEGWNGSGGGPSDFEPKPPYQNNIEHITGNSRVTPDISADADPYSGVAVYNSSQCGDQSGWTVVGGTSLAAPLTAGMADSAGHFNKSSAEELAAIYANRHDRSRLRDVIIGKAGRNSADMGYDAVTGVGTPLDSQFDASPQVSLPASTTPR